ncbi:MAG TPA: hypothetical protein VF691_10320, partial [Cytophagaceae bacterium]
QDNKQELFFIAGKDCKSWTVFRYFINGQDFTSFVAPCNLDNTLTFCTNGSYTDNEDETKCDPSLPQIHNQGTFTLTDDGSGFNVTSPFLTGDFTIVELKPNILKAYFYDANQNGAKIEFWLYPASKKKGAPL